MSVTLRVGMILMAALLLVGCGQRQIPKYYRSALDAASAEIYSGGLKDAALSLGDDSVFVSKGLLESTVPGRSLTSDEFNELMEELEKFDQANTPTAIAACSHIPQMVIRLQHEEQPVDLSIDPDCGHIVFSYPGTDNWYQVFSGEGGFGLWDWAKKIDPEGMLQSQP
jgi:hypothetical protein